MIRKKTVFVIGILTLLFFTGCSSPDKETEKKANPGIPVTLTGIRIGQISDQIDLIATSSFMNKSMIQSPTAAYVVEVFPVPGDVVRRNEVLMTLKTKEAEALQMDSANPLHFSGVINIKAAIDGILTWVDHPKGDFVLEGELLATIAVPGSLVFILEVPYEMTHFLYLNNNCEILLSDGMHVAARIKSRLPVMTGSSQTQKYIIQPIENLNLPENLIAKIRITRKIKQNAQILPKSCVLTDEIMKEFWVMKMINDSIAVKIPVKTGITEGDKIEISDPEFSPADRFLRSGNYGAGDTSKVVIVRSEATKQRNE